MVSWPNFPRCNIPGWGANLARQNGNFRRTQEQGNQKLEPMCSIRHFHEQNGHSDAFGFLKVMKTGNVSINEALLLLIKLT
jgi:hypothetical protein